MRRARPCEFACGDRGGRVCCFGEAEPRLTAGERAAACPCGAVGAVNAAVPVRRQRGNREQPRLLARRRCSGSECVEAAAGAAAAAAGGAGCFSAPDTARYGARAIAALHDHDVQVEVSNLLSKVRLSGCTAPLDSPPTAVPGRAKHRCCVGKTDRPTTRQKSQIREKSR